jgi:hypothetical protein
MNRINLAEDMLPPSSNIEKPEVPFKVGDAIIFYRSDYERGRDTADPTSKGITKYDPAWSLPSRVTQVKDGRLQCVEMGTARTRQVPFAHCKLLPSTYPESLRRVNAEHVTQNMPRRLPNDKLPFSLEFMGPSKPSRYCPLMCTIAIPIT